METVEIEKITAYAISFSGVVFLMARIYYSNGNVSVECVDTFIL